MNDTRTAVSTRTLGPAPAPAERRTRLRLRELCDEVLASYRLASDRDLFAQSDRELAKSLFPLG